MYIAAAAADDAAGDDDDAPVATTVLLVALPNKAFCERLRVFTSGPLACRWFSREDSFVQTDSHFSMTTATITFELQFVSSSHCYHLNQIEKEGIETHNL